MKARTGLVVLLVVFCFIPCRAIADSADFVDVPGDFWAYASIRACCLAGIVGGYWDNTYRPSENVTRAAMAVYAARALAGGDGGVPPGPGAPTFSDVGTGYWAYRYIEYAVAEGVVGGYRDGTYRPEETVSRGAMAVYMARAIAGGDGGVPPGPGTASFSDVPTDYWAFKYVEYCKTNGVVGGYWDGTYRPEETVDRAAMAVYVGRAFALVNPFAGTYAGSYAAGSSGYMTLAVDVDGSADLVVVDLSQGVLAGSGTVSETGAVTAAAQNVGGSVSVSLSGQFTDQGGSISGSGTMTGSISAAWEAEWISEVGFNAFTGNWSGTYWGSEGGSWQAVFAIDGSVSATALSPSVGVVTLGGTVTYTGDLTLEGSGSGPGGPFTISWAGTFWREGANAVGEGTWVSTSGYSGDWSGARK